MTQRLKGLYAILSSARAYSLVQDLLGARAMRRHLIERHVRPRPGDRLLDIGCGPGDLLRDLPESVDFTGADLSADYIEAARKRFPGRGDFRATPAESLVLDGLRYDHIVAVGLLHHLSDEQASTLLKTAMQGLEPGGAFVSVDPVFSQDQSRISRLIMQRDRGLYVRTQDEYRKLGAGAENAETVSTDVTVGLLRIPYQHCFMRVQRKTDSSFE